MAARVTYYTENVVWAGCHYSSSTTMPITASFYPDTSGWKVGSNASPNFMPMDFGNEASSVVSPTPIATLNTASNAGNALFVIGRLTGSFLAGRWNITQSIKANTRADGQDGGFNYLFFKGTDPTGSNATLITASYGSSSVATNLTTTARQVVTCSYSQSRINMNNEYLFVTCQWSILGAGGNANDDVNLYLGGLTGSTLSTPIWIEASQSSEPEPIIIGAWKGQYGFWF